MTYVEYSISLGEGILIEHRVRTVDYAASATEIDVPYKGGSLISTRPLTESEAQDFHTMHGGWVAV